MMTPNDHMSHDLSYFSGPRTSGAANSKEEVKKIAREKFCYFNHLLDKVDRM